MSEDNKDRIIQDFATNLIRLGNECRDWAAECKDLKAEVERLTAEISYDKRCELHIDKLAAEFTQAEVKSLKAEVERLEFEIEVHRQGWNSEDIYNHECKLEVEEMRRAAKEGKQS